MATTNNTETETLRTLAIAYRHRAIANEQRVIRNARSNYLFSVEEIRETARELIVKFSTEIGILARMPVDVSDDEVRRAMGVA